MMKHRLGMLLNTTRSMAFHFPSRASEWATTFVMFNWGFILYITSGDEGDEVVHPIETMERIFTAESWGIIFMVLSFIRFLVLLINGALRHSPHFRSALAFIACFGWFQINLAFLGTERLSTALAVYPVLLILDFYNAYRIAVEARITDEGIKNDRDS